MGLRNDWYAWILDCSMTDRIRRNYCITDPVIIVNTDILSKYIYIIFIHIFNFN